VQNKPNVMAATLTSASGLLALLNEPEPQLQVYALKTLNTLVDEFWAEISDNIQQIEVLYENESFEARELAALVASKVYYHIGSFKSAMIYALAAGKLFDIAEGSLFVRTLVSKCIDEYIRQRNQKEEEQKENEVPIAQLEKIVDSVFEQSYENAELQYALGIALEARRLDRIEEAITKSGQQLDMLNYCFKACMGVVISRDFRQTVLKILVNLYRALPNPDWIRICEILIFLDDAKAVGQILSDLLHGKEGEELVAYQIAFDLCGNASQQFRLDVRKEIVGHLETDSEQARIQEYYSQMLKNKEENERQKREGGGGGQAAPSATPMETSAPQTEQEKDKDDSRLQHMKSILSGTLSINMFLEFLHRNNHTDKLVLKNIKTALESRSSIVYSSIIICHGFMNAGTTNDFFLRDNLEWLSRATNWSKFTATASLGVLQKGHYKESLTILAPYLPQQGASSSPYSEGGALYALGLIHANYGEEITDHLKRALLNAGTNEIVQHGACLGLGVAAMATRNMEIFGELKNVLYTDSAVAGEASGLAMGLVMMGSASDEALQDMLAYAHDTQHEKIIRGLAVGMALIMCGREEEADTLIEQLMLDKDPILRYGGMYTIAMAYCGTANNSAIRRLLHVAVSDVSNDVRRAAVIALGFLLFKQPEQCPKLVSLLAESYNPHVRYGATLAVGISCAGTGLKAAVDLLEPLAGDGVDFVRQGALIALAMVLVQTSKAQEPRVEKVRKLFADKIGDKHEDIMAKLGACLASGIIDAGGRNCTIRPQSVAGHTDMTAVVGLAVFTQYWYWHPLAHFLCLAFTPTALIGLNKDLKMPVFSFRSNAPPSLFAYPPKVQPPAAKAPTKLRTAELSTTKKAKIRQRQKDKEKEGKPTDSTAPTPMETEKPDKQPEAEKMDLENKGKEKEKTEEKKEEKKEEPAFEILNNPARVTVAQVARLSFDTDERYKPVKQVGAFGISLLRDSKPDLPETFVTPLKPPTGDELEDEGDEPEPPEPFEFDPAKEE